MRGQTITELTLKTQARFKRRATAVLIAGSIVARLGFRRRV